MGLGILINDVLDSMVRFVRRTVPDDVRDRVDEKIQEPVMDLAQKLYNLKERPRGLRLAEEYILPGEEQATQEIIHLMNTALQKRYNTRFAERAGNTKTYGLVKAEFSVLPDLPEHLRVGIFKEPRTFKAWMRFGGPGPEVTADHKNNGLLSVGLKLTGVEGEKLIDDEKGTQDFLGITGPTFTTPNVIENVKLQRQILKGTPIFYFINPFDSHILDSIMQGLFFKNNSSPLEVQYYSCVPFLFGEGRAMKYTFKPQSKEKTKVPKNPPDQYLRESMVKTLNQKDVYFDFMIQFQTDSYKMPIEDASVLWPEKLSPFIKVATIRIPQQKFAIHAQDDFARSLSFNPWHSIPQHRPLGNQNRARKYIYLETSKYRQRIGNDPRIEPTGDETFS